MSSKKSKLRNLTINKTRKKIDKEWKLYKDTWSLDMAIADYIVPRLKKFMEVAPKYIEISKERETSIYKFLESMKQAQDNLLELDKPDNMSKKEYEDGLNQFPKIFNFLWW